MDPTLKAKWIKSIKESPLYRGGGYADHAGDFYSATSPSTTCPACAMGKLYQLVRTDYPDVVTSYNMHNDLNHVTTFLFHFASCNGDDLAFYKKLRSMWQSIIRVNDNSDLSDEQARDALVALIDTNF